MPFESGSKHIQWKGGRSICSTSGYVYVYAPQHPKRNSKNRVKEHRLVWERTHNACLLPWADVHHKNGIKHDNDPTNLEAMTHSTHRRIEMLKDMSDRSCVLCGSTETYIDKRTGRPIWLKFQDLGFACKICHMRVYNALRY